MDAYSKDMYKCTYANYGELRNNMLHQYMDLVKTRGDSYSHSTVIEAYPTHKSKKKGLYIHGRCAIHAI